VIDVHRQGAEQVATATTEFQLSALIDVFSAPADTTPLGGNGLELCQPFVTLLFCRVCHIST